MSPTAIALPWPPSMNHYWRHVGRKVLISAEGRAYRDSVAATLLEKGSPVLTGELAMSIVAHPPAFNKKGHRNGSRTDLDNLLKPLLDAMQHGGLYENDGDIVDLRIRRGERAYPGCVMVTLSDFLSQPVREGV